MIRPDLAIGQAFYAAQYLKPGSPDATLFMLASSYDADEDGSLDPTEFATWVGAAATQSATRGGTMLLDITPEALTTGFTIPHGWHFTCVDPRGRSSANSADIEFDASTAGAQVAITLDDYSALTHCVVTMESTNNIRDTALSASATSNAFVQHVLLRNKEGQAACDTGDSGATACVSTFGVGLELEGTQKSIFHDIKFDGFYTAIYVEREEVDSGNNHTVIDVAHFAESRFGIFFGTNAYTDGWGDMAFRAVTFENSVHKCFWVSADEEGGNVQIDGAHFECGTGVSSAGRSIYINDPDFHLACYSCTMVGQTTQDTQIVDAGRVTFYSPWFQDDEDTEIVIGAACQGFSTDGCKVVVAHPNLLPDTSGDSANNYEEL